MLCSSISNPRPTMTTERDLASGRRFQRVVTFLLLGLWALPPQLVAQEGGKLTFRDLMKVRQIQQPSISPDGEWIALHAVPDRGDGEVLVHSADGLIQHAVPLGASPVLSPDGAWVAMRMDPSFEARETAEGDAPRPGLGLLNTGSGELSTWEAVREFGFSGGGGWMARLLYPPVEPEEGSEAGEGEAPESTSYQRRPRNRPDPQGALFGS